MLSKLPLIQLTIVHGLAETILGITVQQEQLAILLAALINRQFFTCRLIRLCQHLQPDLGRQLRPTRLCLHTTVWLQGAEHAEPARAVD